MAMSTIRDRVKAHCVEEGDCWIWLGNFRGKVPVMRYRDNSRPVRRALALDAGMHPSNYVKCGCGNFRCVNPEHAAMGKPRTIMAAIAKEANAAVPKALRSERVSAGRRPQRKLDAAAVMDIRYGGKPYKELASTYNVDRATIADIKKLRTYKDVGVDPFLGVFMRLVT